MKEDLVARPFQMEVEEVYSITGRGTIACGYVEAGVLKVGDELEIVGLRSPQKTVCLGIEHKRKLVDKIEPKNEIGILLRSIERVDVFKGQVLTFCNTVQTYMTFSAECYIFTEDECGVDTTFDAKSKLNFAVGMTSILGEMCLRNEREKFKSGEFRTVKIEFLYPVVMEVNRPFFLIERNVIVGIGVVKNLER